MTVNSNAKRPDCQAPNSAECEQKQYDSDGVGPEKIAEIDRTDQPKKSSPFGRKKEATKKVRSKSVGRPPKGKEHVRLMYTLVKPYELLRGDDSGLYMELKGTVLGNEYQRLVELSEGESPFTRWLRRAFRERYDEFASTTAVNDFVKEIRADAGETGTRIRLDTRIGAHGNTLYVDLGNDAFEVVEIDENGWRIVRDHPTYFRRPVNMQALPKPEQGDIEDLLQLLSLPKDSYEAKLLLCWIIQAYLPNGPYCHAIISGESGSAKSSLVRMLKRLTDPCKVPYTNVNPRAEDIAINALNNRIVAIDNLSYIRPGLSDIFCQLSTGFGISKRKLYSDNEESSFYVQRPAILTSISVPTNRSDLISRCIFIQLKYIERYITEGTLGRRFDNLHAKALGVIFNAVSCALRNKERIELSGIKLPRMADVGVWIEAATPALGYEQGELLEAYTYNTDLAMGDVAENSLVASILLEMLERPDLRVKLRGGVTMLALWTMLMTEVPLFETGMYFPGNPRALRRELDTLAPVLHRKGVRIEYLEHTEAGNMVSIWKE